MYELLNLFRRVKDSQQSPELGATKTPLFDDTPLKNIPSIDSIKAANDQRCEENLDKDSATNMRDFMILEHQRVIDITMELLQEVI